MPSELMRILLLALAAAMAMGVASPSPNVAEDDTVPRRDVPGTFLSLVPVLDGRIGDGEWPSDSRKAEFFDESTGSPAPIPGEFWLAYDKTYIYFAARLKSPGNELTADEFRENVGLSGNDSFGLAVDCIGSLSSFNRFLVNPNGATNIQIAGGRAAKTEWLGSFEARASIHDDRWEVEARVSWALMTTGGAGRRDLRFNVGWYVSKHQRTYVFRYEGNDKNRIPYWTGVEVPDVPRDRSLKLLPYVYTGVEDNGDFIADGGLDFKTSLTDRIEFVGTVNPDFRNIESQILSLDFSFFERLAGESRPFFLEGQEYFKTGHDHRLFASQRIREFDTGVKAYGNLTDKTVFGALTTADFGERVSSVFSMSHKPNAGTEYQGGIVAHQETDRNNTGATFRASVNKNGIEYYGGTQFTSDEIRGEGFRSNLGVFTERGGGEQWFELVEVTPDFFPRIGFSPEQDMRGFNAGTFQRKPRKEGPLMETEFFIFGEKYWRTNGDDYRSIVESNLSWTWRDGTDFDLGGFVERFEKFDDYLIQASLEKPRGNPYRRWEFGGSAGQIQETDYSSLYVSLNYRPIKRLQTSLRLQYVEHFEPSRQVIGTWVYDIGKYESISGRAVLRDNDWNGYVSYRMSGKRGVEYFVILGDPNARTFQKSLVFKAVVPFSLKL